MAANDTLIAAAQKILRELSFEVRPSGRTGRLDTFVNKWHDGGAFIRSPKASAS
jgi:hypothetical protein